MPGLILNTFLHAAYWVIYGPASALVPLFLLYGTVEYGLSFLGSRSRQDRRRDRWLDGAVSINCTLGIVVWLWRDHLPLILPLLLVISILATVVTFILTLRGGKDRQEEESPAASAQEEGRRKAATTGPRRPRRPVARRDRRGTPESRTAP